MTGSDLILARREDTFDNANDCLARPISTVTIKRSNPRLDHLGRDNQFGWGV
jgi:hypothetical protein